MNEPLSYTVKEAARVSGLGRTFLFGEIAAGRLPKVKRGTRTLIMRADLLKYLEDGKEVQ